MIKRKPKNVAPEVPKKVPKRAKNHRTRSNPFEKADEEEYIVRKIDGSMYSKEFERGGWRYYTYWENLCVVPKVHKVYRVEEVEEEKERRKT